MSLFLKVIGALAKGAGDYLVEKAKLDAQAARDALLYSREFALKALQHQYNLKELEKGGEEQRKNISATGTQNRLTARDSAVAEGAVRKSLEEDKQAFEIEFEKLKSQHRMTEDQASQARAAAFEVWKKDNTIAQSEVTADGRMVIWSGTGKSRIVGKPGSFTPPRQSGDSGPVDVVKAEIEARARAEAEARRKGGTSGGSSGQTPPPITLDKMPPPPDGKPGRTAVGPGGKRAYWNGKLWVPMTPANEAEQRRLLYGE